MRVVFDTNIFVLNFIGNPATDIVDAAFSDLPGEQLSFFYSVAMLQEYRSVLLRLPEVRPDAFDPQDIDKLLAEIERHGILAYPAITLDVCSHEPDNRFLECAVVAKADYVVTVNTRHFPASYQGIETISPQRFHDILFAS